MDAPLITVVLSTYNGERFLAEAVESVLGQTFRDFEFICVDDGSSDGSAAILDRYRAADPRVRFIRQDNQGFVDAMNLACGLARGQYLARMDHDDVAVPDRFERQLAFLERHPEVGVLGGAVQLIDPTGNFLEISRNPCGDGDLRAALLDYCAFWHPTVMMRKAVFEAAGGYRKVLFGAEDYDLWFRLADLTALANLPEVLLHYRMHPHQITVERSRELVYATLAAQGAAACRRSGRPDLLDGVDAITPEVLAALGIGEDRQRNALAMRYLWSIRTRYRQGDFALARSLYAEMAETCDLRRTEAWIVADLRLAAARLHWQQRHYLESALSAGQAALTRPLILGRPFKPMVRGLQSWLGAESAQPGYCR